MPMRMRKNLAGSAANPSGSASGMNGADPDRIPAAVEELLRYDAPVPHSTFRYAVEVVEIGGHSIPTDAHVTLVE